MSHGVVCASLVMDAGDCTSRTIDNVSDEWQLTLVSFISLAAVSDRKENSGPPSGILGLLFVLVSPTPVLEHFFLSFFFSSKGNVFGKSFN